MPVARDGPRLVSIASLSRRAPAAASGTATATIAQRRSNIHISSRLQRLTQPVPMTSVIPHRAAGMRPDAARAPRGRRAGQPDPPHRPRRGLCDALGYCAGPVRSPAGPEP